jgi:signal peptide peptidase-like protein 3
MQQQGRFSLLGLGDIIMPGLVLCFVLRFESRKRTNNLYNNDPLLIINRLTYFQCSLLGYCAGKNKNLFLFFFYINNLLFKVY